MRTPGSGSRRAVAVRALVLTVALAGLAACGGAEAAGGEAEAAVQTVKLTVRFSRFSPSQITVPPGAKVRFVVENLDPIAHELILGDGEVHERHEKGTEPHHGDRPGEVSVAARATAETTFTFPDEPGSTLFGCHLPGHWAFGMTGVVRVA